MHETHLANRIISQATARARELGIDRVGLVRVRAGKWTHIQPLSFTDAFEKAAQEAGMAGAQLEIEMVDPECRCEDCGAVLSSESASLRCEVCGSAHVVLQQGEDVEIVSVG